MFLAGSALAEIFRGAFIPVLWWMILTTVMLFLHIFVDAPSMSGRFYQDAAAFQTTASHRHPTILHFTVGLVSKIVLFLCMVTFYTGHSNDNLDTFNDRRYGGGTVLAGIQDMMYQWTTYMLLVVSLFAVNTVTASRVNMSLSLPKQVAHIIGQVEAIVAE